MALPLFVAAARTYRAVLTQARVKQHDRIHRVPRRPYQAHDSGIAPVDYKPRTEHVARVAAHTVDGVEVASIACRVSVTFLYLVTRLKT